MNSETAIHQIADRLRDSSSVLFITGAGLSADSGLPTYRGVGGMYEVDNTEDGLPIEELLSGEMMRNRPELTWKYLAQIAQACQGATFNRGHEVIAAFDTKIERTWVLTQNVDGFHRAAGSSNVIDIHGDMHELWCTGCSWRTWLEDFDKLDVPPRCPKCDRIARPYVVLFNELLPFDKVDRLQEELKTGFEVIVAVGTSALFPYIAGPVFEASGTETLTVEINPGTTELSSIVDVRLEMPAAKALDAIWNRYQAAS